MKRIFLIILLTNFKLFFGASPVAEATPEEKRRAEALADTAYQNYLKKCAKTRPETKAIQEHWPQMPPGISELIVQHNCVTHEEWKENREKLKNAVLLGNIDQIKKILKHLKSIEDADGNEMLITAASLGLKDVVEELLAHGANVNARSMHGSTPLMLAVLKGNLEMVKLLLAHGADKEKDRAALIDLAISGEARTGEKGLLKLFEADKEKLKRAVLTNNIDQIREVLKPPLKSIEEVGGNEMLILAASLGFKNAVEELLAHGANVNATDMHGNTALDMARDLEIVKLLLAHGAKKQN